MNLVRVRRVRDIRTTVISKNKVLGFSPSYFTWKRFYGSPRLLSTVLSKEEHTVSDVRDVNLYNDEEELTELKVYDNLVFETRDFSTLIRGPILTPLRTRGTNGSPFVQSRPLFLPYRTLFFLPASSSVFVIPNDGTTKYTTPCFQFLVLPRVPWLRFKILYYDARNLTSREVLYSGT